MSQHAPDVGFSASEARQIAKFEAKLGKWVDERLAMFDGDAAFRDEKMGEFGGREAFATSLAETAAKKVAGATEKLVLKRKSKSAGAGAAVASSPTRMPSGGASPIAAGIVPATVEREEATTHQQMSVLSIVFPGELSSCTTPQHTQSLVRLIRSSALL